MRSLRPNRLLVTGGSGFIGTNLVECAIRRALPLLNIDIQPPLRKAHNSTWCRMDILESDALKRAFAEFQPDWVVHLAARTDCDENTTVERDYQVNTLGTESLLEAVRATPSVSRLLITSTQFVYRPGVVPKNDYEYDPHTVYGHSKVVTEQLTRSADLPCTWTIIRPTNIWGPWHLRYREQFLRTMQRGLYVHPGGRKCVKSYGYVGNVVHQIFGILDAPAEPVNKQTFYVGDMPIDLLAWVNEFSLQLRGKRVRTVPYSLMKVIALCGDILSAIKGKPFLINSRRLQSMTEDYVTPMRKTFDLLGDPPISMAEGVRQTVQWLREFNSGGHSD